MDPAIAICEYASIAHGIAAGDAMVKRSPLDVLLAGTVHPGRYLVLVGGATADVEEALLAARELSVGPDAVTFLPDVHPQLVAGIGGARRTGGEALGVLETRTVPAIVAAVDAALKYARVVLRELRLADGLGGKGYALLAGPVTEVEAAVEHGLAVLPDDVLATATVVAQLHPEMDANLQADARFAARTRGVRKPGDEPDDGSD